MLHITHGVTVRSTWSTKSDKMAQCASGTGGEGQEKVKV